MPRWRSSAMSSSSCSFMSRRLTVPVNSSNRSARVLLPWSMWATIEKLRINFGSGMEEGYGRQDAGDREFYGGQQASFWPCQANSDVEAGFDRWGESLKLPGIGRRG